MILHHVVDNPIDFKHFFIIFVDKIEQLTVNSLFKVL